MIRLKLRLPPRHLQDMRFGGTKSHLRCDSEVRWPNKGKVLARVLSLIGEIKDFLKQIIGSCWLIDLAFLLGVTDKLNSLNLELRGRDRCVAQMIGYVK
jgi:hypothetical protein